MSDKGGYGKTIKVHGVGHDEEGPYVVVTGLSEFNSPVPMKLRIGDAISLKPDASFTWTLNGEWSGGAIDEREVEEAVA